MIGEPYDFISFESIGDREPKEEVKCVNKCAIKQYTFFFLQKRNNDLLYGWLIDNHFGAINFIY